MRRGLAAARGLHDKGMTRVGVEEPMSTFTVHVPADLADDAARAERTVFVREGFDWAAFLFGPLSLLYRRLWRAAFAWAAAAIALFAVAAAFDLSGPPRLLIYLVLAVLTGLEAAEARRRALGRAGFLPAALVSDGSRDGAERRFFAETAPLLRPLPPRPGSSPRDAVPRRLGVIGLFPMPGDRAGGGPP